MKRHDIRPIVHEILETREGVSNLEIVKRTGLSRQAVHRQLRQLVKAGLLLARGAGRGARYVPGPGLALDTVRPIVRQYACAGLQEDRVWNDLVEASGGLADLPEVARSILDYSLTEMVNNAIDHSASSTVEVRLQVHGETTWFEVCDEGVGLFWNVQRHLGLPGPFEAGEQLSKGKVTTDPARHTGEGLFFTSKIADQFEAESNGVLWIVDNVRSDQTLTKGSRTTGSRIHFEIDRGKTRTLESLFFEYTDEFEFTRTRIVVRLFERGVRFVSRSEAKRLTDGLERFRHAILDFKGVEAAGQGFCDGVFRVWARTHPETRLDPVNMSGSVEFMVRRALRTAGAG